MGFTVSGKITLFISTVWMVNSPVVLFVRTQSSHVWCTAVLLGAGVGICMGGKVFVTSFSMRLYPFRRLSLILYLCTGGILKVMPSWGCLSGGITSV